MASTGVLKPRPNRKSIWPRSAINDGLTIANLLARLGSVFESGVRSVWIVDPKKRTVRQYFALDQSVLLSEDQSLDGGAILPGFVLRVKDIFERDEA